MTWPVPKYQLLPAVYLLAFLVLPRQGCLVLMTLWMVLVAVGELLRRRRPEVGAWTARHGISEDLFWMTLGVWLALVVFAGQRILMVSIGFVALGNPVATWVGQKYGKRPWPNNPAKTYEGSAGFFVVSFLWSLAFVKPVVGVLACAAGAWMEAYPWPKPWRTSFVLPVFGTLALSIINIVLGRR